MLHTQISPLPERSDANTIFFPSGENCGADCKRVEEISLLGGRARVCKFGSCSCQIFTLVKTWVYAKKCPCRDNAGSRASSTPPKNSRCGVPPLAEPLHKLKWSSRMEKSISWPSGVQEKPPPTSAFKKVSL